ncbi:protein KTI12 homolog isoform X2 [Latimeria chalumnae]|uniref:protein KTI12 homolog isoform X2 n=1 Tax=Latimeria chalumnae TaxID=7897 RepID=UPI0003C1A66D|nr:PREDICTED: protein KTI12 homolog isoform X2 [Latimeria chalumnae]|eukprot:XP_005995710.1 PREDICTED: protein KTI12 homolog isoform X2 [Latimeria chalumnae]
MPLVLMCGFPCSGKSRRAAELKEYLLKSTDRKVYIVGEETLGLDKNSVFADPQKEKNLRGALRAEVERRINKEDVVVLDSLNYIKGYRYELFCLIKHAQTPHCLIHCLTAAEVSSLWNTNREAEQQYTQDIFDALVMRFEAPDSQNRWDSPLFTVQKEDTLPFETICDAIFHRKAPPPNQSTQSAVLSAQKTSIPGDLITVPGAQEKIELTRNLNMAELRKLRRQFISYTKMHPTENISQIANMFVQYLNKSIH